MPRPATARRPAPVVGGNGVLCVPHANNSPVNFTDPTGHCINNYEIGSEDMDTCVAGWSAVTNYLTGAAYGPGGSGHFPNELVNDWLLNADIGTLENLMRAYGIDYGYTWTPPQGYAMPSGGMSLRSPEARAGVCQYWQACYVPELTLQEIPPDAIIIPGISFSAAGIWYGVAGGELVGNWVSNEVSIFSYYGQGSGVALEADKAWYGGIVWNLEKNQDYEGLFENVVVDAALFVGVQGFFFWEAGTTPFTGETWGFAIGPSGGFGFGVTHSYTDFTCVMWCGR